MTETEVQERKEKARECPGQGILLGIDIGSTTTKLAAVDAAGGELRYFSYERHHSMQRQSVLAALKKMEKEIPGIRGRLPLRVVFTGSGARELADALQLPFIQEVVANSIALKRNCPEVRTAIELGGQDAKMIFFRRDEATGEAEVTDMRMNGSCAGGTGAFLDEIASLLRIPIEDFHNQAAKGKTVYEISGRCGVYAKTDIQPLLNQGVSVQDLALSAYHAIAKQTIGGLAQGLEMEKPVAFEGGPFCFHPELIRVFAGRLKLTEEDIICPKNPECMVAYGAALSLDGMFRGEGLVPDWNGFLICLEELQLGSSEEAGCDRRFFENEEEKQEFYARHGENIKRVVGEMSPGKIPEERTAGETFPGKIPEERTAGETFPGKIAEEKGAVPENKILENACKNQGKPVKTDVYLGIDSGSTTTKFVLLDEDGEMLDSFYAANEGDPLRVAKEALSGVCRRFRKSGRELDVRAVCTTGYGEMMFYKALPADCHMVETVAHAKAAARYVEDASFILDIGGQDMKAIWLDHGVITNIVVNEACSSGCGSFLESFAATLGIPVEKIAEEAFASESPAQLGSRCTVFMNSRIVSEQRNGKKPGDIMAGLCRSIIENVFTKVIRLSSLESLGEKIVVQGGTFQNDAVLRAMEQYLGREVTRAPYPGLMGAVGAAMTAREWSREHPGQKSSFPGLAEMEKFTYETQADVPCPFCANHCRRTVVTFANGNSWVTNNRCERGEVLGDPHDQKVRALLGQKAGESGKVPDLFEMRKKLLFADYVAEPVSGQKDVTIGIPRVLAFWDSMPFWTTFFRALGFRVKISEESTREMYEDGRKAVTSDTVCFPAKLVHGHIRALEKAGVDGIFFPAVTTVPPENGEKTSESMCAVVKGYPLVVQNSDNPQKRSGIPVYTPVFHWCSDEDRDRQLIKYMKETFDIPEQETAKAAVTAAQAQSEFRRKLKALGAEVLAELEKNGGYAVVLAARPYQNDALVNHGLPKMFIQAGIPVLTADSLPETEDEELQKSRLDIVNNFHARMLSSAVTAAKNEHLEYVQLVSFGCGHDAYLSDEIIRMMKEISGKAPLVLKLDESDAAGPLRIRVRSFIETVNIRRQKGEKETCRPLPDPYPVKFVKEFKKEKTILVPNTSHAFSRIMSAAMKHQGLRTVSLEPGREEAIRLGKKYVHNDICFPAQIVIGEVLSALKSGKYDPDNTAVAMGKYIGDCRLTHYSALLRKALDEAGYPQVPILTNDGDDEKNLHPGYRMDLAAGFGIAESLPMIDALEELLRKMRPYETVRGAAEKAFGQAMDVLEKGLETHGARGARKAFKSSIEIMKKVPYDRSRPRPQILIVGEYLLNFHPGANHDIEKYLERNGFEIIEAKMTDVIRKSYFCRDTQNREYRLKKPAGYIGWNLAGNKIFDLAHDVTDRIASAHPLYRPPCRLEKLVKKSDGMIYHTFDAGEGVLIPAEIIHHAEQGCRNFVILQPFGCIPNHVVGRGVVKRLKELYPDAQILPLDYDPDVSFANVENRLQMLITNCRNQKPAA